MIAFQYRVKPFNKNKDTKFLPLKDKKYSFKHRKKKEKKEEKSHFTYITKTQRTEPCWNIICGFYNLNVRLKCYYPPYKLSDESNAFKIFKISTGTFPYLARVQSEEHGTAINTFYTLQFLSLSLIRMSH